MDRLGDPAILRSGVARVVGIAVVTAGALAGGLAVAYKVINFVRPDLFVRFSRQQLPGFALDLPLGEADRTEAADYRLGAMTVNVDHRFEVRLRWEPGQPLEEQDVDSFLASLGGLHKVRDINRGQPMKLTRGARANSWELIVGKTSLRQTSVVCGMRRLSIGTFGDHSKAVDVLHERIASSVVCGPDRLQEDLLSEAPVVLPAPETWSQVQKGSGALVVSNGRFFLRAHSTAGHIADEALGQVLPAALGPDRVVGPPVEGDRPFSGTSEHEPIAGWISTRRCEHPRQTVMLQIAYDSGLPDAQDAREIIRKVRCRNPGEPAQRFSAATQEESDQQR